MDPLSGASPYGAAASITAEPLDAGADASPTLWVHGDLVEARGHDEQVSGDRGDRPRGRWPGRRRCSPCSRAKRTLATTSSAVRTATTAAGRIGTARFHGVASAAYCRSSRLVRPCRSARREVPRGRCAPDGGAGQYASHRFLLFGLCSSGDDGPTVWRSCGRLTPTCVPA